MQRFKFSSIWPMFSCVESLGWLLIESTLESRWLAAAVVYSYWRWMLHDATIWHCSLTDLRPASYLPPVSNKSTDMNIERESKRFVYTVHRHTRHVKFQIWCGLGCHWVVVALIQTLIWQISLSHITLSFLPFCFDTNGDTKCRVPAFLLMGFPNVQRHQHIQNQ